MRAWIAVATLVSVVTLTGQTPASRPPAFDVVEATITQMQRAMAEHRLTSRELVTQYLNRIALYDKGINAAISINPRALEEADARDRERAAGRVRGPLHGIPIALKDNIHTIDIRTTGGALAFANFTPPYDATLTKNLREAGAIIIAKAVLTELANWVSGAPTPMPGNYSAVGGFSLQSVRPAARPARVERRPARHEHGRLELGRGHGRELLGRQRRDPTRPDRSSTRRCSRCSSGCGRRRAASAVTASFRSPPIRTPPGRWRAR